MWAIVVNRSFQQILRTRDANIWTKILDKFFFVILNFDRNFEQELGTKVLNKSCKQKFLTKAVNKSWEQELCTKAEEKLSAKFVTKKFVNKKQKFWTRVVNIISEQKLNTRVVNKSYEQVLWTNLWTSI